MSGQERQYKQGDLVVVSKWWHHEYVKLGVGLLVEVQDRAPRKVKALIFGKILILDHDEIRHMTQAELEPADGLNEKLPDYEALNREDEESIRNAPAVGDLALGRPSHTNLQHPVMVVDIKNASVVVDDETQTFYVDNHHGITWFDELPDDLPMAQVVYEDALYWLPLNWLVKIPSS